MRNEERSLTRNLSSVLDQKIKPWSVRRRRRCAGRRESKCKKWGEGRALRLDVPIRRDRDSTLPLLDVVYFVPKVLLLKWRWWCEKVTASAPATRPSVHPLVCPFVRLVSAHKGENLKFKDEKSSRGGGGGRGGAFLVAAPSRLLLLVYCFLLFYLSTYKTTTRMDVLLHKEKNRKQRHKGCRWLCTREVGEGGGDEDLKGQLTESLYFSWPSTTMWGRMTPRQPRVSVVDPCDCIAATQAAGRNIHSRRSSTSYLTLRSELKEVEEQLKERRRRRFYKLPPLPPATTTAAAT